MYSHNAYNYSNLRGGSDELDYVNTAGHAHGDLHRDTSVHARAYGGRPLLSPTDIEFAHLGPTPVMYTTTGSSYHTNLPMHPQPYNHHRNGSLSVNTPNESPNTFPYFDLSAVGSTVLDRLEEDSRVLQDETVDEITEVEEPAVKRKRGCPPKVRPDATATQASGSSKKAAKATSSKVTKKPDPSASTDQKPSKKVKTSAKDRKADTTGSDDEIAELEDVKKEIADIKPMLGRQKHTDEDKKTIVDYICDPARFPSFSLHRQKVFKHV